MLPKLTRSIIFDAAISGVGVNSISVWSLLGYPRTNTVKFGRYTMSRVAEGA